MAIATANSTRMDTSLAEGLSSWITTAMDHLKEWAGIGALTGLMVLASLVCLWCICHIRVSQHRNAVMIMQAFKAIEAGQSSWAGEMAQWLRALTALPKVLSSIPSNHMVAHNHL